MSRLPRVPGKQLLAALARAGFHVARVEGNHHVSRHDDGRSTVVPVHAGETIGPGLLNEILRDVELDRARPAELL